MSIKCFKSFYMHVSNRVPSYFINHEFIVTLIAFVILNFCVPLNISQFSLQSLTISAQVYFSKNLSIKNLPWWLDILIKFSIISSLHWISSFLLKIINFTAEKFKPCTNILKETFWKILRNKPYRGKIFIEFVGFWM